jgi:hypothetical protein
VRSQARSWFRKSPRREAMQTPEGVAVMPPAQGRGLARAVAGRAGEARVRGVGGLALVRARSAASSCGRMAQFDPSRSLSFALRTGHSSREVMLTETPHC